MRIGHGYDVHRLVEGRQCILCGVKIPVSFGPVGHSDADVPTHALIDALLGASALGDIGKMFPDDDDKWLNADSMALLKQCNELLNKNGFILVNADITIIAQIPKISPYVKEMRSVISRILGVDISQISVKATTEEGLGFTGNGSGIAAHAVVLIDTF